MDKKYDIKNVFEYDFKSKTSRKIGDIKVFRNDLEFYDLENDYYWNDSFLSSTHEKNNKDFTIEESELWFENETYYITSDGIYRKSQEEEDELIVLSTCPVLPCVIFKSGQIKHCKIKYKTVGKIKSVSTEEGVSVKRNKSLYAESIIRVSELTTFKATNKTATPEHINNGWLPPVDNVKEIRSLFEYLLSEAGIVTAFKDTGWQYDPILERMVFVTPSNNYYMGIYGDYTETKGTFELWAKGAIICCRHSNRIASEFAINFGSFAQGLIESNNNISPIIYIEGPPGSGKSTEQSYVSTILHRPNPGISGLSSMSGIEKLLVQRNNSFIQIEELDGFVIKKEVIQPNEIEKMLALANGNVRAYMKNKDEVNDSKSQLVIMGTGNRSLEDYLSKDKKGLALLDRMLRFNNEDKEIKPLPKTLHEEESEDGTIKMVPDFDNSYVWSLMSKNYGWGFVKAIEKLSSDPEYWKEIFITTKLELETKYKELTKFKDGDDASDRQINLFSLMSIGIQLMREILGDESADQAQSVLDILFDRLIKSKVDINPRINAIKTISRFVSLIALNKKCTVWKNYAWSESCGNFTNTANNATLKNLQRESAELINNSRGNIPVNCIIIQDEPFMEEFDFKGEILIPFSTNSLKFGNETISIEDIKKSGDVLELWKTRENKGRTKGRIEPTKKAGLKEKAFFPDEETLLRIEINFLELYKEIEEFNSEKEPLEDTEQNQSNEEIKSELDKVVSITERQKRKEEPAINKVKRDKEAIKGMLNLLNN